MRVGIIGGGSLGTALAKRLGLAGHSTMLSFTRNPAKLAEAAKAFGAQIGTPAEVVTFGDVVALTMPWTAVPEALSAAGSLNGKVVWDCTNALKPDLSGLVVGTTTSGAEQIAKQLPGARLIKGIPPFAELLHSDDPTIGGDPVGVLRRGQRPQSEGDCHGSSARPAVDRDRRWGSRRGPID